MITNDSWPPLDQPIIQPSCRVSSGSAIIRNSDQGPIPYSRGSTLIRIKVFHLSTRSSRGLGHRPFTAVTRVQIPYESPFILPYFYSPPLEINHKNHCLVRTVSVAHDRSCSLMIRLEAVRPGPLTQTQVCPSIALLQYAIVRPSPVPPCRVAPSLLYARPLVPCSVWS